MNREWGKWGEGNILTRVVPKGISEEIIFKQTWMKKSNKLWGQGGMEPQVKETANAKVLRQKWGWYIWGTERKSTVVEQGRERMWNMKQRSREGQTSWVGVYLNAVGIQWKVLASSRLSNLWKDSAGLLTCKGRKPSLFMASLREIDTPSWVTLECGLQGCNLHDSCSPP